MHKLLEAADDAAAVEQLHQRGCTDGLPVIVPTPDRVDAMVARVDLDPDLPLGVMGPKFGAATVRAVATSAVMAGCLSDHFPVVVAAVKAVCREEFDLTEVSQTTHCVAPLILVNGPARHDCGPIASGAGVFGPGDRASAAIGRALSLAAINIGGRKPGVTDMAIFSSPGKYSACFAEAEEESPFLPFHVAQGYTADDSVVSLIGVEAPHSLILEPTDDLPADAERLIRVIAGMAAAPGGTNVYCGGKGGFVVVLNPEHAALLHRAGYDRARIAAEVRKYAVMPRDQAKLYYANLMLTEDTARNADAFPAFLNDNQIMIVVAGGVGTYSTVFPTWSYAPHGSLPVSEKIDVYPVCEPL